MAEKSMRFKVADLIEEGLYTKVEIAEKLETKVASISSNMTYLRWGGKFIIWDADKKLSFTDELGFDEWTAANKTNSKGSKAESKLTPAEQHAKLTKTIATQSKQLVNWQKKVKAGAQDDETILPEAEAQVTLFGIKILRNQAKLDALGDVEVEEDESVEGSDDQVDETLEDAEDELL
ncbi:MAG: hypothetical protein PF440_11970 [Thiomicrorhabdus sp.]|jgi:hypothetical protein|nr:hypothetical protein [Thiomicrorhabdus sp.]